MDGIFVRSAHYVKRVHSDFIECNCGHLAVTESDFEQHVQQIKRDLRSVLSVSVHDK